MATQAAAVAFRAVTVTVAAVLLLAACTDSTEEVTFDSFLQKHGRSYEGSAEYEWRQELFGHRLGQVKLHNARDDRLWTAGVNDFTDRTDHELAMLRGWRHQGDEDPFHTVAGDEEAASLLEDAEGEDEEFLAPPIMDWRNLSVALQIPNQGSCGSCWAVTATTVMDAHYELYGSGKAPMKFSAQELVSCVPNPRACGGGGGCEGATVELAMEYIMKNGLRDLATVPYKAADVPCREAASLRQEAAGHGGAVGGAVLGMTGWRMLPRNKYVPLMQALVQEGPVAVSVAARGWFHYHQGIYDDCHKNPVVDHAVTAYGFGKMPHATRHTATRYWLIRNSWGQDWGEAGFIRLLRQKDEGQQCGMDGDAQKGTACKGEAKKVKVCGTCGILYDSVIPRFSKTPGGAAAGTGTPAVAPAHSEQAVLLEEAERSVPSVDHLEFEDEPSHRAANQHGATDPEGHHHILAGSHHKAKLHERKHQNASDHQKVQHHVTDHKAAGAHHVKQQKVDKQQNASDHQAAGQHHVKQHKVDKHQNASDHDAGQLLVKDHQKVDKHQNASDHHAAAQHHVKHHQKVDKHQNASDHAAVPHHANRRKVQHDAAVPRHGKSQKVHVDAAGHNHIKHHEATAASGLVEAGKVKKSNAKTSVSIGHQGHQHLVRRESAHH